MLAQTAAMSVAGKKPKIPVVARTQLLCYHDARLTIWGRRHPQLSGSNDRGRHASRLRERKMFGPVPPPDTSPPDTPSLTVPDLRKTTFSGYGVLASPGARLAAQLLDAVLVLAFCLPGFLMIREAPANRSNGILVLVLCSLALESLQALALVTCGQTFGKRVMGVRIVRLEDEGLPGFFRAVFVRRWLIWALDAIPVAGVVFGIADVVLIFGVERRCLHDYFAGTVVVTTTPQTQQALWKPPGIDRSFGYAPQDDPY
jgi:uncharacterized RDD family membrane protein YckC